MGDGTSVPVQFEPWRLWFDCGTNTLFWPGTIPVSRAVAHIRILTFEVAVSLAALFAHRVATPSVAVPAIFDGTYKETKSFTITRISIVKNG